MYRKGAHPWYRSIPERISRGYYDESGDKLVSPHMLVVVEDWYVLFLSDRVEVCREVDRELIFCFANVQLSTSLAYNGIRLLEGHMNRMLIVLVGPLSFDIHGSTFMHMCRTCYNPILQCLWRGSGNAARTRWLLMFFSHLNATIGVGRMIWKHHGNACVGFHWCVLIVVAQCCRQCIN